MHIEGTGGRDDLFIPSFLLSYNSSIQRIIYRRSYDAEGRCPILYKLRFMSAAPYVVGFENAKERMMVTLPPYGPYRHKTGFRPQALDNQMQVSRNSNISVTSPNANQNQQVIT